MQSASSDSEAGFRNEVRAFLERCFTPELRRAAALQSGVVVDLELGRRWHRILFEQGWIAPHWPKEYGGTGWSPVQRHIYSEECAQAGTPSLSPQGLGMVGPMLMRYGTQRQKDYFLPRILSGEDYWCQGYSEPQAGSDLATLQCRAEREGDDYVINGTKIWTTHAHYANWIFVLVRTSVVSGKPQAGITFVLVPMSQAGIGVRPILSVSGEHEVNQVFFDNVRVPVANRVGEENDGWSIAKYLLEFERGGSYAPRIRSLLEKVRAIAASEEDGYGLPLGQDPLFRAALAETEVDLLAIDAMERRVVASMSTGQAVGNAVASVLKVQGTELYQRVTELAVQALGPRALPDYHRLQREDRASSVGPDYAQTPVSRYLNSRAATIYGGSSEIQRNILAKVWLGL
jgi:alkylation response protein AidB-like acyl-CoA dehydrogenase